MSELSAVSLLMDVEIFLETICDSPYRPIDLREARRLLDAIVMWRSGQQF